MTNNQDNEINKQGLAAPIVDKFQLLPEFLKVRGLIKQHLNSYNYFVRTGIKKIMRANNEIKSSFDPTIYLRYTDIRVGTPCITINSISRDITPQECRLTGATYAAPIFVDMEYMTKFGKREVKNFIIGKMPVMLRSCRCLLNRKDEEELARLGECPLDPGRYFVVKGTEKVILIQEQLSKNRIIIDTDNRGCIQASVVSSTETRKSKTVIVMEREQIYLNINQFTTKVPIMAVMKAMGMESDQEVVQMLGRDPRYSALLLPSIEECASHNIYTQQEALEFLEKKVKSFPYSAAVEGGRALAILRDIFVANIPVHHNNFRLKCIYVTVMLRRMMEAILNKDAMDDKDYVGNKRFELSGQLLSLLFEDLFMTMNESTMKVVDHRMRNSSLFDIKACLDLKFLTSSLVRALSTGNWAIRRFRMQRTGITAVVTRLSYISMLSSMTKISPQFEKSMKVSGPRALHPSQWGMLCPCGTPEGQSCGLVKNLALTAQVTIDEEVGPIIYLCCCLGVEDLELLSGEEVHTTNAFLIILNGLILGKHRRPRRFADAIRKLRRGGKIGEFVSIFVNDKHRCVYMSSDGGRVCRPLVVVEKGLSKIKEHHMTELKDGIHKFHSFVQEGLIEYLDVNETNNALIALHDKDINTETTHLEIEPLTILGVCAGLIPFPHHNQSPRNTYQCAMGKQAMGNISYNQLGRMDSLMHLLVYPQRPLLTTRTIELVGYDKLGAGQNATVAVMSNSGYDIEDAIVLNKSSLDRGFGRCIVIKKYAGVFEKTDKVATPVIDDGDAKKMQSLDNDGLASPGEIIKPWDIYFYRKSGNNKKLKTSYNNKDGETTFVDRASLFSDDKGDTQIRFMFRQTRRPEVGDKFSSRHGQKGVCGIIVPQEDFPFSERGICPDLIMNPHGFPSRMTVGKMIELIGSKAGVSNGKFHYGSAFGEFNGHADKVETISETLVNHGFSYSGKDFIYSGITGMPLQAYIFMGPIYYQKLKHMVADKLHARASGPRVQLTRQPTEGRSRNGGLRIGEMERDCLVAYGASMLMHERMMVSSDPWVAHVCSKCGLLGYYNHKLKFAVCSMCKNGDSMATIQMPYACKLLFQELQSMNIVPRVKLTGGP